MLQSGDLITQTVIGNGAEIVPTGVALGAVLQYIQRFSIAAVAKQQYEPRHRNACQGYRCGTA